MATVPMQPVRHLLMGLLACWLVTATPGHVVDGDTFDAAVSVWTGIVLRERVRVLGVDTPELSGTSKEAGLKAKAFTQVWLDKGPIEIKVCKRDSFGRVLATVTRDGENLAVGLIAAGHGVPYSR